MTIVSRVTFTSSEALMGRELAIGYLSRAVQALS